MTFSTLAVTASDVAYKTGIVSSLGLSVLAFFAADSQDVASSAMTGFGVTIGLAAVAMVGNQLAAIIKGYWDDKKDKRANDLAQKQAENARHIEEIRLEMEEAKERRKLEREYETTAAVTIRNKLEDQDAKLRHLKEGQGQNGVAIQAIGDATGITVAPSIPPEGTDEHPVIA